MTFTKHVKERAAKNVLKKQRFRVWLVWTLTLMLVFSSLTIPLLGLFTSPFVFGIACLLLLAPAAFRARSLSEPILHPATTLMPTRASLLGLRPESRPSSCFHMFSLSIRLLAVGVMYFPVVNYNNYVQDDIDVKETWGRQNSECCLDTYWETKSACEHVLSAHRSCHANAYKIFRNEYEYRGDYTTNYDAYNAYWNLDRCRQLLNDPNCTWQMWNVLPVLVGNDSTHLDWNTICQNQHFYQDLLLDTLLDHWFRYSALDGYCVQPPTAACADYAIFTRNDTLLMGYFAAPGCIVVDPEMLNRFCATMSQLPKYVLCSGSELAYIYARCMLKSESWLQGSSLCDTLGRLHHAITPWVRSGRSEHYLGDVGASAFMLTLFTVAVSPLVAIVLLMISCCLSWARRDVDADVRRDVDKEIQRLQKKLGEKEKPAKNDVDVAVHVAGDVEDRKVQEEQNEKTAKNDVDVDDVRVDEEIQESQEEIDKVEKAANMCQTCQTCIKYCTNCMNMVGRVLLSVDLLLVFMDIVGDIAAVFTWVSTGHVWFGICQILIILRGVPAMVRLQREKGLVNEVRDSLKANTLTDDLYDLMLQEKTVESVYTSLLLAYGIMHTFDSRLAFYATMAKWALSLRSVTNGCFIQFHLTPGDVETSARPFLATLPAWPLGRRYHLDAE